MLNLYQVVFKSLAAHHVKYVMIGGMAAAIHGVPRFTLDVDLLIEPTLANADALINALADADVNAIMTTTPEALLAHEITMINDYVNVDIMTTTPGITFADAWSNRVTMEYEGVTIELVSRPDLIRSKRAAGRKIDLDDVGILEMLEKESE